MDGIFLNTLEVGAALNMVRAVTAQEVKEAIFSMGNDKSPRPDSYTAAFFMEAWESIANDVIKAVQEFFRNGNLLKELIHTIISLILKVSTPTRTNDYRLISCCNVLFKVISKIISNRIKGSLNELLHNSHLDRGMPRCAFKVDIQKAYDTIDWEFLRRDLVAFSFHHRMIAWIMECVTTTLFLICINGSLHGHFLGKHGLQQGNHLSPYLFTLIMEVLTLMLQRRVRNSDLFTYHCYCPKMDLINICFVDDLFLFAHGDVNLARIIMDMLHEFKLASRLTPSLPKSTAYFCNVLNHTKISILYVLPFEEGRLSVKYLGVPLVSSRLIFWDWRLKKGRAKVSWDLVYRPRNEGGLGIRKMDTCVQTEELKFLGYSYSGMQALAWFDKWCNVGPLSQYVTTRDLFRESFTLSSKVNNLIVNEMWSWPREWNSKYPTLASLVPPMLVETPDQLEWRDLTGHVKKFDVAIVWETIRPHYDVVSWHDVVWYSYYIPRYKEIVDYIIPFAKPISCKSVIAKLVLSVSTYYVWQERNARLFTNKKRSAPQVIEAIVSSIHLKLLSYSFKKSKDGIECSKLAASRDKVVNMAVGDSDNKGSKLHSGKVRLADDMTLDIAGVGDVVLKTSFGTSWTLKDVRIGMNMLTFKGNILDVQKVDIYFYKSGGLGKQENISFIMSVKTRKLQKGRADHAVHIEWTGRPVILEQVASYIVKEEAYYSTGFEGRIVGCKPNPTSFSTDHAVWHDCAVWHEPDQFTSELNNISLV
nr:hypothetical protein [Tanacetum cinerariifolium]